MDTAFLASDLRRADPDRYLLSLFAPAASRAPLWALFLFNHEIAKTRAMVTDTNLGLIRLQWWRDEIARVYGGGSGGQIPLLSTLAPLIHQQRLPQEWFDAILYAHEFDLEDVAPANIEGLKHYADFTTTPLNQLALKIVGEGAEVEEIRTISINFGLCEAMRSVPLLLSQGRCLLPEDMVIAKNLTSKKIIDFNHQKEISEILELMYPLFDSYRKPKSRLLAIQQRMTFIYLDKMKKYRFDMFLPEMQLPPAFFALRLALGLR